MNIRDIAKKTGVSSTTVSRVINQSGYVKEETKQKILQVIRESGYVPNAIARSLSMREASSIAVIVPDITNEFFSSLIGGIGEIAEKENYNMVLYDTGESGEKEHSALVGIESQYMAGVIITPVSEQDGFTSRKLLELERKNIPVVLADRDAYGQEMDGVFADNFGGSYSGVEALIQEGHRKIATIAGPVTSLPGRERLNGYRKALCDHGIAVRDGYIVFGDFKIEKAYERTKELLALKHPPTAIFTSNNNTTLGALKCFTERRMRPGVDISLIGFDQIETLKLIDYPLTVVERDFNGQGRETMNLMLQKIKKKCCNGKKEQVHVPCRLVRRGSEKIEG